MKIRFNLNGVDVEVDAEPNERLVDMLRGHFGLRGAKSACHSGLCGCCTVFFNKAVMPSCLIPAFRVQGAQVMTLEGFAQTSRYEDIIEGYRDAGVENCGYCNAAKILIAESLLAAKNTPDRDAIASVFDSVKCRCTDRETLVNGVLAAALRREKRKKWKRQTHER